MDIEYILYRVEDLWSGLQECWKKYERLQELREENRQMGIK